MIINKNRTLILIFLIFIIGISLADSQTHFKIQPTVRFITLSDTINKTNDGTILIFAQNPSSNNFTVSVDLSVIGPPEIYFYNTQLFRLNETNGITNTFFAVKSGQERTIYINVKSDKIGAYSVKIEGEYYPVGIMADKQKLSFTQIFKVAEPSINLQKNNKNISEIMESNKTPIVTSKSAPNFSFVMSTGIIILIYLIKRK